jgi:DNA-directed RNA polymerase beta' subunit
MSGMIQYIQFGCLTAEDWLRISVAEINEPSSQGDNAKDFTNTPYDRRLGVIEENDICETCENDCHKCPGHFGHTVLSIPAYNIEDLELSCNLNRALCTHCARPRILPEHLAILGLDSLEKEDRFRVIVKKCSKVVLCPWKDCNKLLPQFSIPKDNCRTEILISYAGKSFIPFSAGESLNVFMRVSNEHLKFLGFNRNLSSDKRLADIVSLIPGREHLHQYRPESMIFTVLPVIPPIARPYVKHGDQNCDDDLTDKYNCIIKTCKKINAIKQGNAHKVTKQRGRKIKSSESDIVEFSRELQAHVSSLLDNRKENSKVSSGNRPFKSLSMRTEGKKGRLRENIAGKRVDFSARSVIIGGGPLIKANELGVPEEIAKVLTRKHTVVELNIDYLQDLLSKGYVNYIVKNGSTRRLDHLPDQGRSFRLRIGDIVGVQIVDGDPVVFNRQPSLRKESMLAFYAKRIKEKAFRLSTCMCTSFNADKGLVSLY